MSEFVESIDLHGQTVESGIREGISLLSEIIREPQYVATGAALDWAIEAQEFESDDLQDLQEFLWLGESHLYDVTGLQAYADGYSGMYVVERAI